ncbi:MAG TPA: hypothetical protein VJ692_11365 [Nitrospiraceae bacterium]|nr:hypothetical protein [Nitrospiraceae bacterium]
MWTRARKALTAIFWSHVFAVAANLFLVPLYLTYWSAGVYGEWLVLFAVAGYLSTLDLGLNLAMTNRLTQAYCRHDFEDYTRCQHSAFAFYIVVVLVSGLLLSGALWMFPLPDWLGLKQTDPQESAWVLWLLGLNVLLTLPATFMWSMYRTMGHVSLSQWMWNTQQLLTLGMIPVILALGGGMKSVASGQLAVLIILLLYAGWDLRRRAPAGMPGLRKADRSVLRELTRPSLLFGLVMVSNVIILHGSVIVVSTMLGSVAVALFVTSRTLVNLARQAGNAFLNVLWPEVTGMEARGEWSRLRSLHRLLMATSTTVCIGFAAALWHEGSEVMTLWTRGQLVPDPILLRLLLILLVFQSTWLVSMAFPAAANRHEKVSWLYLASALLGIGAGILCARTVGIWGIPIGLLVGEAVVCYHLVIRDTCRLLGEDYRTFAFKLWLGILSGGGLALTIGWIAHVMIPGPFWVRWLGVGSVTLATAFVVCWSVELTPEDREQVFLRLRPPAVAGVNRGL